MSSESLNHICGVCSKGFKSLYHLNRHTKTHNIVDLDGTMDTTGMENGHSFLGLAMFGASEPGPIRTKRVSKDRSTPNKSDSGGYCPLCGKMFTRKDHCKRHLQTVHRLKPEEAPDPLLTPPINQPSSVPSSLIDVSEPAPSAEPSEPTTRAKPSKPRKSATQRSHQHGDPWCRLCDKFFSRKDHLIRHMKNVHSCGPEEIAAMSSSCVQPDVVIDR